MRFRLIGVLSIFAVLGLAVSGCHAPAPANPTAGLPSLTFFAAENPDLPAVAQALNQRLQKAYPVGPSVKYAGVSLEEAQIAVGCIEATPACWAAVAKSVSAPALLLAEVSAQKDKRVHLVVRIFNSEGRSTVRVSEQTSANAADALGAVPKVVDGLVSAAH